jgi:hypothetical protein
VFVCVCVCVYLFLCESVLFCSVADLAVGEQLYLDILEMDKGSLKAQSCDCLLSLVQDPKVKELWHKLGSEPSARLASMLRRFRLSLRTNLRSACANACDVYAASIS